MNTAQNTALVGLEAITPLLNSGGLIVYSGTMPATPETALSGNTALATLSFQSTAFAAPTFSGGYQSATANFVATTVTPGAGGTANFARGFETGGTTVVADFTIQAPWQASTAVIIGQYVTNGGNSYVCTTGGATAASGGPTGTGTGITDGTAVWNYSALGADIMLGAALIQTGVPLTVSSFVLRLPAS